MNTTTKRSDILDVIAGDSKLSGFPYYTKETTKFFNHLIHQGALQRVAKKNHFYCPLPSFRTYLIETAQSPEKDETYSLRYGDEIYSEGEFDRFSDAREWAVKQLGHLNADREASLWQGAVKIDILRDAVRAE